MSYGLSPSGMKREDIDLGSPNIFRNQVPNPPFVFIRDQKEDYTMKKNPFLIAGLSLMALAAAGCNTVEGAGQDVEATGEEIEETARDAGAE
jgi:predicted small secreted protein